MRKPLVRLYSRRESHHARAMDLERRHKLTFEQAEGVAPLPQQLEPGSISAETRAHLWAALYAQLNIRKAPGSSFMADRVYRIVCDEWVQRRHGYIDDVSQVTAKQVESHKRIFSSNEYASILGLVQFHLRHTNVSERFVSSVGDALTSTHSAYRVFEGRTIAPVSSEQNAVAVTRDLAEVKGSKIASASAHLEAAAMALSSGDFPGSVRESIHAVDSVARTLAPKANDLGPALTALSDAGYIHGAMKAGFSSLYGYASNEKGIRHALLDDPKANVTEADALYMFGACAAFCAYMVAKGREFGLLT